ncbi:MAG: hypothetical protein PHP44_00740 [Kiritimatiellae bacterium]|nr:hypothetical protein [Kiritimatiellia bacterium]MDD4734611.1 hypothetical protein [Kiritimatiellia bacterium]
MITKASGVPNLAFYTNFQPVFDGLKKFTNSYSRLLQTSSALINNSISPSAHISPRSIQGMVSSSTLGKHIDVIG